MSTLPFQDHSETSQQAAESIRPTSKALKAKVYQHIESKQREGCTDEEIQRALSMPASTQRPRRIELVNDGLVVDSGDRRKTVSKRKAVVWVAKKFLPHIRTRVRWNHWKQCCERGISIYPMPKVFQEHITVYAIHKTSTFVDRKVWQSTWTYPTLEEAQNAVLFYFETSVEPTHNNVAGQRPYENNF